MSDRHRSTPDAPCKRIGTGLYARFLCDACSTPRPVAGRRVRMFRGVRRYVCANCADRNPRG